MTDTFTTRPAASLKNTTNTSAAAAAPTKQDEIAFISGITATKTLAAVAFATWNGDKPATYDTQSSQFKWGGSTAGTAGGRLTYYFDPAAKWTAAEKAALASGLTMWSAVANVTFAQSSASSADLTFKRNSDGQAYESNGYYPHEVGTSTLAPPTPGTFITLDTSGGYGTLGSFSALGGYGLQTVLHEEGHFLGLGHAGAYNGDVDPATQQYSAYDNRMYSIMSYIDPSDTSAKYYASNPIKGTDWHYHYATTWMPLDILAIQRLYGVAVSTPLSGGQIFGYGTNITGALKPYFDFTVNTSPVITLWDKGVNNTLNLSGCTTSCRVDLNPGRYSSFLGMTNNLAIAYGTVIDHAVGGSAADVFTGNTVADTIYGMGGGDRITLSATPTLVDGGAGTDTLVVRAGTVVLDDATFKNIERVSVQNGGFLDMSRVTTAPASIVSASTASGAVTIAGSAGNDTMTAGAGTDTFDEMMAGFGRDAIAGANLDVDRFRFSTDFAADATAAHLHFAAMGSDTLVYGDAGRTGDALTLKGIGVDTVEAHRSAFSVTAPQA